MGFNHDPAKLITLHKELKLIFILQKLKAIY
jgi:hypothetical protein